jgi:hypothetical protein
MFKKKQKLKLIGNCPSDGLVELFPLQKSKFPDWFKHLPKNDLTNEHHNNVRVCSGLTDLYSRSVSIPMWQDMSITIDPMGGLDIDAPQPNWSATTHPLHAQAPGAWPGYINVKLSSPWVIECEKDVQWTMMQPVWDQKQPHDYIVIPGNLEFKYQNQSNINMLFPIPEEPKTYTFKAGDIVAMLVPNFEEDYDVECSYMNHEKWTRLMSSRWIFTRGPAYAKLRSLLRNKK